MPIYEPHALPQYQLSTTADLEMRLGRIVDRDAQIEVQSLTLAPVRILISRSLWDDSRLQCEAPDGVTGSVHGPCQKCSFSVAGCSAFHRILCVAQDDFPGESESGLFWYQFSVRSRNPFRAPRNGALARALAEAMVSNEAITIKAETASNKSSSMHWSIHNETRAALIPHRRAIDPSHGVAVLGVWESDTD